MRKFSLLIFSFLILKNDIHAQRTQGGEISYKLLSSSPGWSNYRITLRLLRECDANRPQDDEAEIGIFDAGTDSQYYYQSIPRSRTEYLAMANFNPCITNKPDICYEAGIYEFDMIFQNIKWGYIITYQDCCGPATSNIVPPGGTPNRLAYTAQIPGTNLLPSAPLNASARFTGADTVVVCAGNGFTYDGSAIDPDGDQLEYSFLPAYYSSPALIRGSPPPTEPLAPPFEDYVYRKGFTADHPLGPLVNINPTTGLIKGIAPGIGTYLMTICVNEIRNGKVIATQRKYVKIKTAPCKMAKAFLPDEYVNCKSFSQTFRNFGTSPLITSYSWNFGVNNIISDTSNLASPTFNFPDSGIYNIKLVTNKNGICGDSTTATVRIFPGFKPGFEVLGACLSHPFTFKDTTFARYGVVNYWKWKFGDLTTYGDTSRLQNATWTYHYLGSQDVSLIVGSDKGCVDTARQTVEVLDVPDIKLAFRDTLICTPDYVQLLALANGTYSWTPVTGLMNANVGNPIVHPVNTTIYHVSLSVNGCKATDSVKVRVVDHVTLDAGSDTTICLTDPVMLPTNSDGLQFQWNPSSTLNNLTIKNPVATPVDVFTTYQVHAKIGSCAATDQITVKTVHYPIANAGTDQWICYNTTAQLIGNMDGSSVLWSPVQYADQSNILNPIVRPPRTTAFVLSAYDTKGCPKPGRDTVVISVYPKLNVSAGSDTIVVVGQPLQFHASGGETYHWSPAIGLNNTYIADPIGTYYSTDDEVKYKLIATNNTRCSDSAFINVKVFKTGPDLFVPTAFTPNGDGLNDIFAPTSIGIQKINYFIIFNRWGQVIYKSSEIGKGWDGKTGSAPAQTGVYLWMVSGVDYTGHSIFHKGTVTLIR